MDTLLLDSSQTALERAATLLRAGALVAFPTETVYGLGADARNDRAVARIFEAKGRPRFNPLIVHCADIAQARRIASFGAEAERLAATFWPGPMTLVLPLREDAGLSPLVTAGLASVAVRLPAHPLARDLIGRAGLPVAAPSANPSGRVSPTRAAHVLDGLSGRIEAVIDGGACAVGVESTIVGLTGPEPQLLRPGGLPGEAIEGCLGRALASGGNAEAPTAPGQLFSHYAPRGTIRLEAESPEPGEIWIGFGREAAEAALTLSAVGDLVEAAANLFHTLREADAAAGASGRIAVSPVPDYGLGRAINDRLRRAAAPRP